MFYELEPPFEIEIIVDIWYVSKLWEVSKIKGIATQYVITVIEKIECQLEMPIICPHK